MKSGPKRTPVEREQDLATVAALHRLRYTQQQIADRLGVCRQQITYDLAVLKKRWQAASADDTAAEKEELLAEEHLLKRVAWDEWSRSRDDRKKERREKSSVGVGADAEERLKAVSETEGRLGDPRYLAIIQAANKAIREMRGMDAPRKIAPTDPQGNTLPIVGIEFVAAAAGDVEADKARE